MIMREALAVVKHYGDVFKSDMPENVETPEAIEIFEKEAENLYSKGIFARCSSYVRLNTDEEIKYALMNYGPVIFGMDWYVDLTLEKGVLKTTALPQNRTGSHAMVIYGWNETGWLIQNSWGVLWGNHGCATLPFSIPQNEAWAFIDEINEAPSEVVKPYRTNFGEVIAKILNFFINLFN